jgi:hypothetical protein
MKRLELRGDPLERDVLADVLAYLHALPECHAWRANSGAVRIGGRLIRVNEPGCADVIVCYRGRFIAVETKRIGEPLRPEQEAWKASVEGAGGIYLRAETWTDVRAAVERLDRDQDWRAA